MKHTITPQRLTALCQINRWRGWTVRPYSVGEHCAIGAYVLEWFKRSRIEVVAFWLHDMHETEVIGDVPRPDKARFVNAEYHAAVDLFDAHLGNAAGLSRGWQSDKALKRMDMLMMRVENDIISVNRDPDLTTPDYRTDPMAEMIRECIEDRTFDTPEKVVSLWDRHGMWEVIGNE